MKKVISFFLLIASSAFAQWQMPARQITNSTSSFGFIPTTNYTVQRVFDWSDDEFARINTVNTNQDAQITAIQATNSAQQSSITNLQARVSTNEVAISNLQASVTSLGTNLTATQNSYLKGTNIAGASYSTSSLTWTINAETALIDTNIFGSSYSNVNQGFTYVNSNLNSIVSNDFYSGIILAGVLTITTRFDVVVTTDTVITNYTSLSNVKSNYVSATTNGTFTFLKDGLWLIDLSPSLYVGNGVDAGFFRYAYEDTLATPIIEKIATPQVHENDGVNGAAVHRGSVSGIHYGTSNTTIRAYVAAGSSTPNASNSVTKFSVYYVGENQ